MTGESPDRPAGMIAAAQPPALEEVHELLASVWETHPDVTPEDRILFEIAVVEIAGNIATHSSDGRPVTFSLYIEVTPDLIEARFRDDGRKVEVPEATGPVDEMAESGRGLAMTADAVDIVEYHRADDYNHWRIAKNRT
jgi:serine/threonine-protein kinase RsbW